MSNPAERRRIILFTLAVTTFFGLLVSGLESLLHSRKAMNALVADQQVILQLFGLKTADQVWSSESILGTFKQEIEPVTTTIASIATVYYRPRQAAADNGTSKVLVFPFKGKGFWDAIEGFLAVDAHSKRIHGIDFFRHAETPGLGGRISEPQFRQRFRGKPLAAADGTPTTFRLVAEGTARPESPSDIDGLTGATETSRAVERIVNDALRQYLPLITKEAHP